MSTAAPSKSTGGGAGHSRVDQTSRFIGFIFIYNLFMFLFYDLEHLKTENLV